MRAEKPEKMVAEMQTLELIDELKTRKNGDDMSWDGFKHILGSYPGIKTKFNNYLNKHETDVVWRAKTQAEQVREFITAFLDGFDDPDVRAKEAVERALRFRQKQQMPTGTYLELRELRSMMHCVKATRQDMSTPASEMNRSGAGMQSNTFWRPLR